jgi:hypothetical protein
MGTRPPTGCSSLMTANQILSQPPGWRRYQIDYLAVLRLYQLFQFICPFRPSTDLYEDLPGNRPRGESAV